MPEAENSSNELLHAEDHAKEALNKLLILGIAARDCETSTLLTRWDGKVIQGEHLQTKSIEILRDAAMAGMDRINGNFTTESVAHSIYDQLFDRFSDTSHLDLVNRLGWISQNKWKLFNQPSFELTSHERQLFKENEARVVRVSDKIFRDQFFAVAMARVVPKKYTNLLEEMIEPDVGVAFLNEKHLREKMEFAKTIGGPGSANEYRFWGWGILKGKQLRARMLGSLASQTLA